MPRRSIVLAAVFLLVGLTMGGCLSEPPSRSSGKGATAGEGSGAPGKTERTSRLSADTRPQPNANITLEKQGMFLFGTPGNAATPQPECGWSGTGFDRAEFAWDLRAPADAVNGTQVLFLSLYSKHYFTHALVASREVDLVGPKGQVFLRLRGTGQALGGAVSVGGGSTDAGDFPWGAYKVVVRSCASTPHDFDVRATAGFLSSNTSSS